MNKLKKWVLFPIVVFAVVFAFLILLIVLSTKIGFLWALAIVFIPTAVGVVVLKKAGGKSYLREKTFLRLIIPVDEVSDPSTVKIQKIVGVAILVVFAGWLMVSTFSNSVETSKTTAPETEVSAPLDPVALEAGKKRLAELKTKFSYEYDEFQKTGWYSAKSQVVGNTFDDAVLRIHVNHVGYMYISDQYYGDNWIFHTHVEVKVGDTLYKSADIPSYDPSNTTNNSSGSVWEFISYTNGRDNGIINAIAKSGDTSIKVRFSGGQGVHDFTLTKRDQQAIKDAYELSELIKKIGNK